MSFRGRSRWSFARDGMSFMPCTGSRAPDAWRTHPNTCLAPPGSDSLSEVPERLAGMPRSQTLWLLALAILFTLLNAFRPLHMDDTAYYSYAAQIADHPLDPYGFEVFWKERPQPAHEVLAPPLLPYYWAAAIRLFGDRPFLWKLWLLPFALLLLLALHQLFQRFAQGFEGPLVWLTVLSPAILPSFNLMLDVPSLA